jgi:Cd2+/Zn2+-exporting ATPase
MERQSYKLKGLDCPTCAGKIEAEAKTIEGWDAVVNLLTQEMHLTQKDETKSAPTEEQIRNIVHKYEPDVEVEKIHERSPVMAQFPTIWEEQRESILRLGISLILFIVAVAFSFPKPVNLIFFIGSYLIAGLPVIWEAIKLIGKGQVFTEYFLMSIATIGAFFIGQYSEAVAVMIFYLLGELFQDIAVGQSRRSIQSLMEIRPDVAFVLNNETGEVEEVAAADVEVGSIIRVRPGERIPLDGTVVEGSSSLDMSALTGESVPVSIVPGEMALSGAINRQALLQVRVDKPFGESTVNRILDLVQNAGENKAQTENLISRFARYYTPFVVFFALGLAVLPTLIIPGALFRDWLYRALVFLVISCPCAFVVSVPLAYFGGIGGASKRGILVKGGNYLEALDQVDTLVFDKTGTLTKGQFEVSEIIPAEDLADASDEMLLELAAYAELHSTHPIADAILKAYGQRPDSKQIKDTEEIAGKGVRVVAELDRGPVEILAGNTKLLDQFNVPYTAIDRAGTKVHVAMDGIYQGTVVIADQLKEGAVEAIADLKNVGIKHTYILTGDNKVISEKVGEELGVDQVFAELLPQDKVSRLEAIEKAKHQSSSKGKIGTVGDGINDAPLLARSDVGIAMGGLGSDAAIEASDIVIMTDEIDKLVTAKRIARKTNSIAKQNIVLALGIKLVFLTLGALGMATMWQAVFADVGVTVLAVLNSTRALLTKKL